MNILELMDTKITSYSKTERNIYERIKKFPDQFAEKSITEISNRFVFTKPSLTRFAKKLGFSGFSEFQYQFNIDLQERAKQPQKSLAESFSNYLKQTEITVTPDVLDHVVKMINDANHIYILGSGLSRIVAEQFEMATRLATDLYVNRPNQDALPLMYNQDDLLIIYSAVDGRSHSELLKGFRKETVVRPHLILITTNAKHPLRHNFDYVVVLPSTNISDLDCSPIIDTFEFLMFNEMLIQQFKKK